MKALILAPFTSEALGRLKQAGLDVIYESWLDTGKLYDPDVADTCLKVFEKGFAFGSHDK